LFALKGGATGHLRLFLATGILGGYTTFSTFSLDAILLWQRHDYLLAAYYIGGSVVLSLLGLFAGLWIVRTALA
jgi:CrcB protein